MFRRLALLCVILLVKVTAARRRCINSGVLFEEKVLRSPIVVYGVSVAKRIYLDSDDELLFNVSFRVDCILKGPAVENRIEITDAGKRIECVSTHARTACPSQVSRSVTRLANGSNQARLTSFSWRNGVRTRTTTARWISKNATWMSHATISCKERAAWRESHPCVLR